MKTMDKIKYTVSNNLLAAIFNGDYTIFDYSKHGNEEEQKLNGFLNDVKLFVFENYPECEHYHFTVVDGSENEFTFCEITGLYSNCTDIELIIMG